MCGCVSSYPFLAILLWTRGYYRGVKLRSRLNLLVVGTLLPVAVVVFLATKQTLEHGRATLERDAIGRARAAMSAVDAHLQGSLAALETLAASRNLESGDIQAFHAESQ